MKIKYDIGELSKMLYLGVKDYEVVNNHILLTPKVASYYAYMKKMYI